MAHLKVIDMTTSTSLRPLVAEMDEWGTWRDARDAIIRWANLDLSSAATIHYFGEWTPGDGQEDWRLPDLEDEFFIDWVEGTVVSIEDPLSSSPTSHYFSIALDPGKTKKRTCCIL